MTSRVQIAVSATKLQGHRDTYADVHKGSWDTTVTSVSHQRVCFWVINLLFSILFIDSKTSALSLTF